MDGTCLNDKKCISEATLAALRSARDAGITVVPTTGRALSCLPYQLKDQDFYRYVISSNGACATDLQTGESLFDARIPYREILDLLRAAKKHRLGISAHVEHQFVLQGELLRKLGCLSYGRDAENTVSEKDLAQYLQSSQADVEEIQLFYFSRSMRDRTHCVLNQYHQLQKAYTDHYVEIYSSEASKGNALCALAGKLGIPRDRIACIGDAENDLSMFEKSGKRFAMGNAIPALKERADMILPDNNDDGVARAVAFLLGEGQ